MIKAASSTVFIKISKSSSFRFSLFVMESNWSRTYWELKSANSDYLTHSNFILLLVLVVSDQSHVNTYAALSTGIRPVAHVEH